MFSVFKEAKWCVSHLMRLLYRSDWPCLFIQIGDISLFFKSIWFVSASHPSYSIQLFLACFKWRATCCLATGRWLAPVSMRSSNHLHKVKSWQMLTSVESFIRLKKAFLCYLSWVRVDDELESRGWHLFRTGCCYSQMVRLQKATSAFPLCDYRHDGEGLGRVG